MNIRLRLEPQHGVDLLVSRQPYMDAVPDAPPWQIAAINLRSLVALDILGSQAAISDPMMRGQATFDFRRVNPISRLALEIWV